MEQVDLIHPDILPNVATIGCFDGVHRGHRHLIEQVCCQARAWQLKALLITFDQHPQKILGRPTAPKLLSSPSEKTGLLEQTGIDYCCSLTFTPELAQLSAYEFMKTILKEKLNVKQLIIGFNHHFGRPAGETADDYRQMGKALGIEVSIADEFRYNGEPVSSSAIRKALCEGELQKANDLLGHHYSLSGTVVEGRKVGRTLGFPTANIRPEAADKLLPRNGSYAVTVDVAQGTYAGMLYIGERPTFDDPNGRIAEVNILHFNKDIYGQNIRMNFIARLRDEQRFHRLEDLKEQLRKEQETVEKIIQEII